MTHFTAIGTQSDRSQAHRLLGSEQRVEGAPFRLAQRSLDRLLTWLEAAPGITWDPDDVKAHPVFARLLIERRRPLSRVLLVGAHLSVALLPNQTRRLLKVQARQTPGAAAWLAQGYLELYRLTGSTDHLYRAERWLGRLLELRIRRYEELAWGWPFDWPSQVYIPADSVLLYTTWQAGRAFLDHFEVSGRRDSLEAASSACRSVAKYLNRTVDSTAHLSFSYSPHDRMQVFNTNALAGGLFCRIGQLTLDREILGRGKRMLNWVADGQKPNGSWSYFASGGSDNQSSVDHYHTAMTLQGLLSGSDCLREGAWSHQIDAGTQFYLENLFDAVGRPKYTPGRTYPIDALSCAEAIIFLTQFQRSVQPWSNQLVRAAKQRLNQIVDWTCSKQQAEHGAFYARVYAGFRLRHFYHRWGQGAMLKALASYLRAVP